MPINPSHLQVDELNENLKSIWSKNFLNFKKVFPLLFVLASIFTVLMMDFSPRYRANVNVTATGRRVSKDSKSENVWLASPDIPYMHWQGISIRKSAGWERQNDRLVSINMHPAELQMEGYFKQNQTFDFFKTQWAGEVEIEANGSTKISDLFQKAAGREVISLDNLIKQSGYLWRPMIYEGIITLIRNLLLLFVFTSCLQIASRTIPAPIAQRSPFPGILAIASFIFFIVAFYPGAMNLDSYYQYLQAHAFSFTDWHPPVMAILWTFTDSILPGPAGMLILQVVGIVYSIYLLSRIAYLKRKKLFLLPQFAIFLPVISCLVFLIIKDVSLAISLLLAFSMWYYWRSKGTLNKKKTFCILVLFFYSSTIRHNSIPAVAPLLYVFLLDFFSTRRAIIASVLMILLFVVANNFIAYTILGTEKKYLAQAVMGHDLMGIYKLTGHNYIPEEYINKQKLDALMKSKFDHRLADYTFYGGFPVYLDAYHYSMLKKSWLTSIIGSPMGYLKHRWILFKNLLLNDEGKEFVFWPVSDPVPSEYSGMPLPLLKENVAGRLVTNSVRWVFKNYGFYFYGLAYILISSLLLALSVKNNKGIAAALALSAILYILGFFPTAPGIQFRYMYWPVFATLLSFYVIWVENDAVINQQASAT